MCYDYSKLRSYFIMKSALIPERLIKSREKLKLNKSQAAELLGLTPIGYLRYEQGLRAPSSQMLKIIALTFKTSVAYLTGETDDPTVDQICISREENAYLFELVRDLSTRDTAQAKRLLTYYKKLSTK